jgi:DmsE family decaheme c-type cytochrome
MHIRKFLVLSTIISILFLTVNAQSSQGDEGFAGDETCMECHEEIYESFGENIHGVKGDPRTPAGRGKEFVCESCHGPGATHAEEGEGGGILDLSAKSPEPQEKKNAVCLQCHNKGKVAMWASSEHETRALTCANCHGVHQKNSKYLAKPTQPEVCAECVTAVSSSDSGRQDEVFQLPQLPWNHCGQTDRCPGHQPEML